MVRRVKKRLVRVVAGALTVAIFVPSASADQSGPRTIRVSLSFKGFEGTEEATGSAIAGNGRWVTFATRSGNLVQGEKNKFQDVFIYDRNRGVAEIMSVRSDGGWSNGNSGDAALSDDSRWIAFRSDASNLVDGDSNGEQDVFIHDRVSGETQRVSEGTNGRQGNLRSFDPDVSSGGQLVAFTSYADNMAPKGDINNASDVFVHEVRSGRTYRVSVNSNLNAGNGNSFGPAMSGNGRYISYTSESTNLVSGDHNHAADIFVYDRNARKTVRVTVASDGTEANATSAASIISNDGRYVVFTSDATNLVPGDTNGSKDVFVHDLTNKTTIRASEGFLGQGNGRSYGAGMSGDGRYIAFASAATNLILGDTNGFEDVYYYDQQDGSLDRISVADDGSESDGLSFDPEVSDDGLSVSFISEGTNLVPDDTNAVSDVFVRGPLS